MAEQGISVPIGSGASLSSSGASVVVSGLDVVLHELDRYEADFRAAVHRAGEKIAKLLENYAKSHHPWTPRTGNTNSSTRANIVEETREYVLVALSAGMDYDIFLELARGGRWAWLEPAVIACKDRMLEILIRELQW